MTAHPDPYHRNRPAAITEEFVARNVRGVMMAAFLPAETIAAALGIGEEEAALFSAGARSDLRLLRTAR